MARTNIHSSMYVPIKGTTTNDAAAAGMVGEYIESVITDSTAFPSSGHMGDLTHIHLTAGDWDVTAFLYCIKGATTVLTYWAAGVTQVSGDSFAGIVAAKNYALGATLTPSLEGGVGVPTHRISLASETDIYLKYYAEFTTSTLAAKGYISARRVR